VLGLSTRKVGETLQALLGRKVSPSTVSQVAKTLDAAVAAFHRRPLHNRYKALMLDAVAGALNHLLEHGSAIIACRGAGLDELRHHDMGFGSAP
jgi:hypothetical protein